MSPNLSEYAGGLELEAGYEHLKQVSSKCDQAIPSQGLEFWDDSPKRESWPAKKV